MHSLQRNREATLSRSRKKPFVWISKKWDSFKERAFRHRVKQSLQGYDPDRDWEELQVDPKGESSWGTKCGYETPPNDEDDMQDYLKMQRK